MAIFTVVSLKPPQIHLEDCPGKQLHLSRIAALPSQL